MLRTGQHFDRFELRQRLGSGGFGEVYLARDPRRDQLVAIKILHRYLTADPQIRDRFLAEARALEQLDHPNVVRFFEGGTYESDLFIVTEFLQGESVRARLDRGPISFPEAIRLIIQVGEALSSAHLRHILHRDLKPENIIIHPQRGAVLLDFGLVRFADEGTVTRPGQLMGTWRYMSPEQLRGEKVDYRSDLFSLGIVLYEALTGVRPFAGEYDASVVYAIMHDEPSPLPQNRQDLPHTLQYVVTRALKKEPEERYKSVSELVTDLSLILEGKQLRPMEIESIATPAIPKFITMAVLCLRNRGAAEHDFIAYGIAEELVIELSRIPRIRISSMTAVLPYKDSEAVPSEIAKQLDVRFLIEGEMTLSNGLLVVTARLHDTSNGEVMWTTDWQGDQIKLIELKRILTAGVLMTLGVQEVTADITEPMAKIPDAMAYEYYLRGKYLFEHKMSAADVEVAAELFRQAIQLEPRLATASIGLARIHIHQGDYRSAVRELESALQSSRFIGHKEIEIEVNLSLAEAYLRLADWEKSTFYAERAKELSKQAGNLALEARALATLIDTLEPQAQYEEAMRHYRRVVQINQQLQRKDKLAAAVKSIAVIYHRRGELTRALHHYNEALELCRWQRQIDIEAKLLNNIGLVQHQLDNDDEAERCFKQALSLHQQLGEFGSIAVNLNNLGVIQFTRGDYTEAMKRFVEAAKAAQDVEDKKNYTLALENQGKTKVMLGDYTQALSINTAARDLASSMKFQLVWVMAERNLGDIALYSRAIKDADEHYRRALSIAEGAELKNEECVVLMSQMKAAECQEAYDECCRLANRTLVIVKNLRMRKQAAVVAFFRHYSKFMLLGRQRDFDKLSFLVRKHGDNAEPPHRLAMMRMLAKAMLSKDKSRKATEDATALLRNAHSLAVKYKVRYEQEWIGDLLKSTNSFFTG